jgi:hypothetical protein
MNHPVMSKRMEDHSGGWRRWVAVVGGILIALACLGFVARVWTKIRSGHGLDTYFTGYGVQFNYIGVAILLVLLPAVLLLGIVLNWWLGRDERDFKRRYKIEDDSS